MLSIWFLVVYTPILTMICGVFFVLGYYLGQGKTVDDIINDNEEGIKPRIKRKVDAIMPSKNIGMPKSGVYIPTDTDLRQVEKDKEWEEEVLAEEQKLGITRD